MPSHRFVGGGIFYPDLELLAVADLHLGYAGELRSKGMFVPTHEFSTLFSQLQSLVDQVKPRTIVINGDFKHSFGRISSEEWRQTRKLITFLTSVCRVVIVAGNHDVLLEPLLDVHNLSIVSSTVFGAVLFLHGDCLPDPTIDLTAIDTIVIGHEHPAVLVSDGVRSEKLKCYLVGTWKKKELIVLPSLFGLAEGTDVLQAKLLSPFLTNISSFSVIGISAGEILPFGTVGDLQRHAYK